MSTKGGVIVETRNINIEEILDNHVAFLPEDWGITFFGSKENESKVREYSQYINFVLLDRSINTLAYNQLLTSAWFWDRVPYQKALIFQHDSKLLRDGIEEFLDWDFIGAPWGHFNMLGGNGGLSLRSKNKMLDVIDFIDFDFKQHGNEDVYFCKYLPMVGGKIAPKEEAMKFSVETIFYPTPIGVHAPEKYLSKNQLIALYANI